MRNIILLNIFVVLVSCFVLLNNTYAEPPDHAVNGWEAFKITKIGLSTNGLSQTLLQNYTTIQDSDFDRIQTLSTPVWIYIDMNKSAHAEGIGTISDIPTGSYYVYAYHSEVWLHTNGNWTQLGNTTWNPGFFTLNGQAIYDNNQHILTTNPNDFIKVNIENNKNTNLTQTLTDLTATQTTFTVTLTATASSPE